VKNHKNLLRKVCCSSRPFTFSESSKYPLQSGKKVKLKVRIDDDKNPTLIDRWREKSGF
jgi:hypothetical protein